MICEWKIGDVFAYRLESSLAEEKGLYGRYALLHKIGVYDWYPNHIIPIVYVKLSDGDRLPSNADEFNALEYVQISFCSYEDRFLPYNFARFEEDLAEKSKLTYEVDEFGHLPEYRLKIITTSKRVIPKKLIYIGNYAYIVPPKKEFVPHSKVNIYSTHWKYLEEQVVKRYCWYNLRENEAYKK